MTQEKLNIAEGIEVAKATINLNLSDMSLFVRGIQNFTLASGKVVQPALTDIEVSNIRLKDMKMRLENASAEKKVELEARIAAAEACINAIVTATEVYMQTEFNLNNPEE